MKVFLCSFLFLTVTMTSHAQSTDTISYTYIEADALYLFPDGPLDNELWLGLQGSLGLGNTPFYLFGEYSYLEFNDIGVGTTNFGPGSITTTNANTDIDLETFTFGLGTHFAISSNTDFITEGAYERIRADAGAVSGSSDGFSLAAGIRSSFSEHFELTLKAGYANLEDSADNVFGRVSGLFKINNTIGINALVQVNDDGDVLTGAGLRVSF